jgi:LytS/YehU family sensor histidine kinase
VVLFYEASYFLKQWRIALVEGEKLRKETVQAQLDGLRSQINPHFLFNSLNTLVSLIPENPNTATDFVHKLSHVYRYLLCMKDKELVTLQTELDFMTSYLFLLKVRFEENVRIDIHISEGAEAMLLPPVSLQLLIENAIKHNVVSSAKPLHIHIFTEKGHLVVRNNLQPRQQLEESTGVGLQNIQTRYSILSTQHVIILRSEHHFTVSLPLL